MNLNRTTIASQLVFLLVLSVVISQAPIIFLFLSRADAIVDEYEQRFVVKKIANIYELIVSNDIANRELILSASNSEEMSFSISGISEADKDITSPNFKRWFTERLGDTKVKTKEVTVGVMDQWYFWFSDEEEKCYEAIQQHVYLSSCPYRAFSVKLPDGLWLNALSSLTSNSRVLIVPVLASALLTMLAFIIVIFFEVRRITQPLRTLSQAADNLGRGQEVDPLPLLGSKELSTAAEAFNEMQERLTRFVQDRTHLLASISHDLRTPITSLRINVEFVENKELRSNMIRMLEDMQAMVASTLTFAHQDIVEEESETVDLVLLLTELAAEFQNASFNTKLSQLKYECRVVNFRRAIRNIIDNAIKYGSVANISIKTDQSSCIIAIQDHGLGIPENKIEDIFKPFFRIDKSRNTESGSVGLGLTIARTIIHKHGGSIKVANTPSGLQMKITLPLNCKV